MQEIVQVTMAEFKIMKAPGQIVTLGLGSCIGVCAYDSIVKLGGMLHIMLPNDAMAIGGVVNPAKFANTGVPLLIKELEAQGASRFRIEIKIVGGAHMFSANGQESVFNIGTRNLEAVEEACNFLGLKIVAKSVGGNNGRSVSLDLETGNVYVKTLESGIMNYVLLA